MPTSFSWDQLKPGHTLCVLYAERKTFVDRTSGIRQEMLDTVCVFRAPLATVHAEAKKALALADSGGDGRYACFSCGKLDSLEGRHAACGGCHLARYCSKDCQRAHWMAAHKALCKDGQKLLRLACLDRHPFDRRQWFSVATLPPHTRR